MSLNNIKVKVREKIRITRRPARIEYPVTKRDEEEYEWYVASLIGLGS